MHSKKGIQVDERKKVKRKQEQRKMKLFAPEVSQMVRNSTLLFIAATIA